jgi:hypothetical protein
MTPTELFNAFLLGKPLGTLTSRTCRQLLDLARNAILSKGREPRFSTAPPTVDAERQSLVSASDQLRELGLADQGAIYASAAPVVGADPHWTPDRVEALLATTRATLAKAPKPAPKPAAKQDLIADVEREFARAKELDRQANAKRTPSPRQAPPRPAPAQAAKPAPTPQPSPQTKTMPTPAATSPVDPAKLAKAILDETERRQAAALVMTRAQFNLLKPAAAAKFCRDGGKITA